MKILAVLILLLAVGCTRPVLGDSTAVQVAAQTNPDEGLGVRSGCGWAGVNGGVTSSQCSIPLVSPDDDWSDTVVLFASIHDAGLSAASLGRYRTVTTWYRSFGLDVIWVEVPHVEPGYYPLKWNEAIDHLNSVLPGVLGCELAPANVRVAQYIDGLHYTDAGAATVALAMSQLDGPVCAPDLTNNPEEGP